MKKSRARVSIEGQCVFLQNSPRIKMFDLFLNIQNYRESNFSRHTFEPLKKIVKILETRPPSSKNAKN